MLSSDVEELRIRIARLERAHLDAYRDASFAISYSSKDPDGAAAKVRRALEIILTDVYRLELNESPRGLGLEQLRQGLHGRLPRTISRHIEVVRGFGNDGTHPYPSLTPDDARVALLAFARVAEWYVEAYRGDAAPAITARSRRSYRLIGTGAAACFVLVVSGFMQTSADGERQLVPLEANPIAAEHVTVEQNPVALGEAGGKLVKAGEYAKAIEIYTKALDLAPKNAGYLNSRGFANVRIGNYEAGFADLSECVAVAPANAWCHYNLAVAQVATGNQNLAVEELRTTLALAGHLRSDAADDPQLGPLRDNHDFRTLVGLPTISFDHRIVTPLGVSISLRSRALSRAEVDAVEAVGHRTDPTSTLICALPSGRRVQLLSRSHDWYFVKASCGTRDVEGFVAARYGGLDTIEPL